MKVLDGIRKGSEGVGRCLMVLVKVSKRCMESFNWRGHEEVV